LVLATLALTALLAPPPAQGQGQGREYEVKAAFLYNFARFVEWPADAFPGPGAPITYCIVGDDPFDGKLEALLRGETVGGRPLALRRSGKDDDLAACQILFLSRSERSRQERILDRLGRASVLTVGDEEDFLDRGGIIGFRIEAGRVRFDVDLEAAERAGLKVSSKLLRVARVRGD
jgi:hypothetical protein